MSRTFARLLPLLSAFLSAQEPPDEMARLLGTPVIIASRLQQDQEQAPSAVFVVTRTDIERYGWRELADILRTLPGFDFGNDGTALIGLSERGIWAHEGKALLMVNGIQTSPLHNGNVNYYGNYPAELIERVEVIRGPGSAVYGQFAGAAVINLITRSAEDPEAGRFTLRGTTLGAGDHGQGGYLVTNGRFSNGVALSLNAGYQTSPFSRQPYVDTFLTGQSFSQDKGNTRREVSNLFAEVKALGTSLSLVRVAFQEAQVDGGGSGNGNPVLPGFAPGILGTASRIVQGIRIQRTTPVTSRLSLETRAELLENTGGSVYPQELNANGVNHSGTERGRFVADAGLRWNLPYPGALLVGGGFIQDRERSVDLQNRGALRDPQDPANLVPQETLQTRYGYLEYTQQAGAWGLTTGGRYEDSGLSHAFAPRLGLTFVRGRFNAKLLYGEAFRSPTLFQTYSTFFVFKGYLRPEIIRSRELELGWRLGPASVLRLNLYRMSVTRAISFGLDGSDLYYVNAGSTHSKGAEASLEVRRSGWGGFANLSYTRPDGAVDAFVVDSRGKAFLGISPLKANLGAYVHLGPLQVAPSLLYASAREGQTARSAQSGIVSGELLPNLVESAPEPGRVLLNLSVTWKDWLGAGTEARLTGTNLGAASYPLLQPYYGAHAPLPANDRMVSLDLVWRF
ncbi:TonB-dependent siderophore receptor [Geothrix sp. 21YS21S-4]|uniref:TonB-dependent receptor plug domain-containing protein n=1 Tax=Geothrix sp. 21YS21S-4 TaxID=3068889 RepID=UPI0027B92C0C|nr:TonB-dependent receptor [Geothrix sp. 21YS21S-4]